MRSADRQVEQMEDVCPVCGHEGLVYGDSCLMDQSYMYRWTCPQCGQVGKEFHDLVFSQHILS